MYFPPGNSIPVWTRQPSFPNKNMSKSSSSAAAVDGNTLSSLSTDMLERYISRQSGAGRRSDGQRRPTELLWVKHSPCVQIPTAALQPRACLVEGGGVYTVNSLSLFGSRVLSRLSTLNSWEATSLEICWLFSVESFAVVQHSRFSFEHPGCAVNKQL